MRPLFSTALAGIALAGLTASDAFAQTRLGPLVSPAELSQAQAERAPVIIDIRAGQDANGKTVFETGHIAGAVSAPYGRWRGPAENPGQVPDDAHLTDLLRSLGVEKDRPVVVVHQGSDETDFGAAARVYWTLKSSGVTELSILNGGVNAWTKDGLPLSTQANAPQASDITVTFSDVWLATREDVSAVVDGTSNATLIDARPEAFYNGETAHPASSRPGTLPHARLFTHSNWFSSGPAIVEASAAQSLVAQAGLADGQTLVSFCNTGHWAATNWFALSELAGVENVKLYPESMVGWSNAGLPMDNVPGRLTHLWTTIKSWF
jgi:thiosulfate/3-mercaptopyruvate sulfurtransferase